MTEERWLPVRGFEDYYEISDFGRLRSRNCYRTNSKGIVRLWLGKMMSTKGQYGNSHQLFGSDGKRRIVEIHRLVAEHFVPNPDNLPWVCHKDDNNENHRATNLYWGTIKTNTHDAIRNNRLRPARGSKSGKAKLTETDVLFIRKNYIPHSRGPFGTKALAKKFGVKKGTVDGIISRQYWTHI